MERTVSFPIGAGFFQRDIFANYLHNIQPVFDGLGVGHIYIYSVGFQWTLPDVISLIQRHVSMDVTWHDSVESTLS